MWCSNVVAAKLNENMASRQYHFFQPREYEQRAEEVWKLDLQTSAALRGVLKNAMKAEHAASAMIFWLQALVKFMRKHLMPIPCCACRRV